MPSKEFKSQLFKELWHLTVFILDNDVRNIQTSDTNLCITFNFSRYLYAHKFWFVAWSPMWIQHSEGLVLGKDTIVSTKIYCSLFIGGGLALRQNLKVRPLKENHYLVVPKLRVFFQTWWFLLREYRSPNRIPSWGKKESKTKWGLSL